MSSRRLIGFVLSRGQYRTKVHRIASHQIAARQCPLWVKSGHGELKLRCPLYPQKRTLPVSFDHLVGTGAHRRRHGEAERLSGLEIDQKLKCRRLPDTIPILVAACDPIQALVVSIARPAGKVTGATCIMGQERNLNSRTLSMHPEWV